MLFVWTKFIKDPENERGGRWVYHVPRERRGDLDDLWLFTVLALIGESIDECEEINGAVVSTKNKADRIGNFFLSFLSSFLFLSFLTIY